MTEPLDLDRVADVIRHFASERDWEQFHTPKNLSMALAGEAGELLEIFQWLTGDESSSLDDETLERVGEELVDILQYLVRIADVLEIDLGSAFEVKVQRNAIRYPKDEVRGSADKR